jgi:hypothetical protein
MARANELHRTGGAGLPPSPLTDSRSSEQTLTVEDIETAHRILTVLRKMLEGNNGFAEQDVISVVLQEIL